MFRVYQHAKITHVSVYQTNCLFILFRLRTIFDLIRLLDIVRAIVSYELD